MSAIYWIQSAPLWVGLFQAEMAISFCYFRIDEPSLTIIIALFLENTMSHHKEARNCGLLSREMVLGRASELLEIAEFAPGEIGFRRLDEGVDVLDDTQVFAFLVCDHQQGRAGFLV
jgi:hypothetical protein